MTPRSEPIEVEIAGQRYRGERIVTGDHDLHQEIRYEHLRKRDPNDYVPGDERFMRAIAAIMLRDLVDQWRAQASRKPVKVEPKARQRRRRSGGEGGSGEPAP